MTYVQGFVVAVPAASKEEYRRHAANAAPMFKEFGATRMVEAWADDVPDGKVTDFKKAVQAKEDEEVVFSWFEYPSKEAFEAANKRMMSDPRMEEMGKDMPFDGQRMIFGGFEPIVEETAGERGGYVDGFVVAVPHENREAYRAMAQKAAGIFTEFGATRVVEAWGDDVPEGQVTDYQRAVKAEAGEGIIYSWVEWPDKEARNKGWEKMMSDPDMKPPEDGMPFDGKRMFWGGFAPLVDTAA